MLTDGWQGEDVSGAEVAVELLKEFGVDHVFGLPGVHNLPIYDALRDSPNIRVITTRNESAASFMAQGYSRSARKLAACLLAPGPGVTNALTGIAEAYMNSTPMIVLSGGIKRSSAGKGAIHDVDQMALLKPVTKWCVRVGEFGGIQPSIRRAFTEASSGRTRPTFIEIPLDIQSARGRVRRASRPRISPISSDVGKASIVADTLMNADRPVMIAGGGILNANATWSSKHFQRAQGFRWRRQSQRRRVCRTPRHSLLDS